MPDSQNLATPVLETAKPNRRRARRSMLLFIRLSILFVFAAAAIAEFGRLWWIADLFGHLRFQYLATALIACGLALAVRRPLLALVGVAAMIPHALVIALVPIAQTAPADDDGGRVRFATVNIQWDGAYGKNLLAYAKRADVDVLTLQEVTPEAAPIVSALQQMYPYLAPTEWRSFQYGVLVLSRHPIKDVVIVRAPYAPMLMATIEHTAGHFRLIAVHAPNSLTTSIGGIAAEYHAAWAHEAALTPLPVIVAGDFNSTPWSARMRALTAERKLAFVGQYHAWPRTWPAHADPVWFLVPRLAGGVPIDHVLVSRHFATVTARRGPYIGSDHYPVAVELRVRR
jgi:endonuclease/exonuclease/phosphatase (EEP) superfamily protein YafD